MADIADKQLKTLKKLIETAEVNLVGAKELLASLVAGGPDIVVAAIDMPVGGKVVEGHFDGQNMVGPDGKHYPIPANYASKSKLVQGDALKLTIGDDGAFVYKQTGPVERKKLIGTLNLKDGQYYVEAKGKDYHVLFASVSFFKGQPGDQVTIVVPEGEASDWAAIEVFLA